MFFVIFNTNLLKREVTLVRDLWNYFVDSRETNVHFLAFTLIFESWFVKKTQLDELFFVITEKKEKLCFHKCETNGNQHWGIFVPDSYRV